ncbi:uncharacterized protein LOC132200865 [Neocloeon triangulifer]|uniref:uncharacterized protein LOC132200865 n=1 Tax=Neocloeon triangulifer TaxID=2078957 RepID=UPI00286EF1D4|nr:uncharacterized protein LOC132200865 [Neocloeon triangulifer]
MSAPEPEKQEAPEWMNEQFFQEVLERDYPGIKVTSARTEPAVAVGENYACIVHRAFVSRSDGPDVHLIIKSLPTSEFRAQMVRDGEITLREVRMYKETLKLLGDPCTHPPCHFAELDDVRDAVVLADLRPLGYKTRDRKLGLDLPHCKLVMEQIGRLHGAGIAMRINDPEKFDREITVKYPDTMFSELNRVKMTPWIGMTMGALADAIEFNMPLRFHSLAKITRELGECYFDIMQEALTLPEDPEKRDNLVFTLNHGDTWSNNILFKYVDGEPDPQDCVLIDFQLSRAVPAVIDLLYFFYSSTNQDLRKQFTDELLKIYWDAALKVLNERGITYPGRYFYDSVADIKKDLKKFALIGYMLGCLIMPIVIANADDAPDLDSITEESLAQMEASPFLKMYSGPLFCRRFREILEDCDDFGAFKEGTWKKYTKTEVKPE